MGLFSTKEARFRGSSSVELIDYRLNRVPESQDTGSLSRSSSLLHRCIHHLTQQDATVAHFVWSTVRVATRSETICFFSQQAHQVSDLAAFPTPCGNHRSGEHEVLQDVSHLEYPETYLLRPHNKQAPAHSRLAMAQATLRSKRTIPSHLRLQFRD